MPIIFSEASIKLTLQNRRKLKSFIEQVLCKSNEKALGNLSFVFCSDEFLLDINRRFLNHDYYTDIITFDLAMAAGNLIEGEIYISLDRVKDNATSMGTTFGNELLRVIFHGVLHLCGYKDKTKVQSIAMRSAEDKYLTLYEQYIR